MRSHIAVLLGLLTITASLAFLVSPPRAANVDPSGAPKTSTDSSAEAMQKPVYVSPITGIRYSMAYNPFKQDNVYTADEKTFTGVEELLNYEAALFPDSTYKMEPSLRDANANDEPDGRLPVIIFLTPQFGHDIAANIRAGYARSLDGVWAQRQTLLDKIMATNILGPLSTEDASIDPALNEQFKAVDSEYSSAVQRMRVDTYAETSRLNLPSQNLVAAEIEKLGGVVLYKGPFVNVIVARISSEGLRELVKNPLVSLVYRDQLMKALLNISVPSISVSDWWNAGYNTATYKLVVADTGVDKTHPALVGKITDEAVFHAAAKFNGNYADNASNPDDLQGHGTHVAGIVTSTDSTYHGAAYGLKGVVNAKFGYLATDGNGYGEWSDAMQALDWAIGTAGASVASLSFGSNTNGNGNGGMERFMDAIVDDLGVPFSAAAGNDGPGGGTLGEPADAFNIISVGAIDDHGTTARTDDDIAYFSSRGPTTDNRYKPDIAAPGADSARASWGIRSCNYEWETGNDWVDYPGTSMAAPHVGGSLVLLLNYLGPRGFFPAIPKALLLENAQDKGTAGPDNDYGWGYIDLNLAFQNKDKVYNDTVTPSQAKFYIGSWAANDRATMVWQKHVVYRGASFPTVYYPLNNLDLFLYNGQTNVRNTASTSLVDDVEQIRYNAAITTPVIKVKALPPLRGVTQEPYALATLKPFAVARPATYQTVWQGPTSVEVGNVFTLTANITNVGDLTSFGASARITPPAGLTLTGGANPAALGDVNPGALKSASWTFRADSVGNKTSNLSITSYSFEEYFNGTSSYTLRVVDSVPPQVLRAWAFPTPQNAGLNVNISAELWDNLAVFSGRANVTGPRGFTGNFTMVKDPMSGFWFIEQPYFIAGNYNVVVWASDMDHWAWNATQFTIIDSTAPSVLAHNAQPNPQQIHGRVNITATIQDQAGVMNAWVEVTDPNIVRTNVTLQKSGNSYWLENQYDILGAYGYRISAIDPSWNWRVATGSFSIVDTIPPGIQSLSAQPNPQQVYGRVNITSTITDVGGVVNAYVLITDPLGAWANRTLRRNGDNYWLEQQYNLLGSYSYIVSAVDIVGQWAVGTGSFLIVDTISPVAEAGPDQVVEWAKTVTFNGSLSTDNFGIVAYTWTFNDNGPKTLNGVIASYVFMRTGRYLVTLTVADSSGNTGMDAMNVTVRDITPPEIENVMASPDPQDINGAVTVSSKITDNVGVTGAWIAIWDPNIVMTNRSMPNVGGDDFAFTQNHSLLGTYTYRIWARDAAGNWNTTLGTFFIKDLRPPSVLSISANPDPQEILDPVQISANVQDNVGVTGVWVEIRLPGGTLAGNYTMTFDTGLGMFKRIYGTGALGLHTFTVVTSDQAGNWNYSGGQFLVHDTISPTISPTNARMNVEVDTPFNFTATANDNFEVKEAFAEIISPSGGSEGNQTMASGSGMGTIYYMNLNLHELGDYHIKLSAQDFGGNWGTGVARVTSADTSAPQANAGPDQTVLERDLVTFNGSASTDAHGIRFYNWTFTDGGPQIVRGITAQYTFMKSGRYEVTLTVTDYAGNSDQDTMVVVVNPRTTGDGQGDQPKDFYHTVGDVIVEQAPLVIMVIVGITLLVIGLVMRRRSVEKMQAEKRRAARAKKMLAMQRAQADAPPPPPPPEEDSVPAAKTPPPPLDEDTTSAKRPPPPPLPPPEDV